MVVYAPVLRCSVNEPLFCQQCESCKLVEKINLTKAWFTPLSDYNKKAFLLKLIYSSVDLLPKLPGILSSLCSKDYQYAISRLRPSLQNDCIQDNSDHSVDVQEVEAMINNEYVTWFLSSSQWTCSNYLLFLLQTCNVCLLKAIKDTLDTSAKYKITDISKSLNSKSGGEDSPHNELPRIKKCYSAPAFRRKSLKNWQENSRIHSAMCRITFNDDPPRIETSTATRPTSSHAYTSARCLPIEKHRLRSYLNQSNLPLFDDDEENFEYSNKASIDIIRFLPVHLSKKIFGYLNENDLLLISNVSEHWQDLAEQVKAELIFTQIAKEDVMVMQAGSAKVPHPSYARLVPVHIPLVNPDSSLKVNNEGKHVDVVTEDNEFATVDMESCYDGYETQKVFMDERNVYCSSYNVLVLDSRKDANRHIHYNHGKYTAVGSVDRKIVLLDVDTAEKVKVIIGHTGSIKCVFVDERNNIVISAGYDTSVRVWDLTTGKCKNIFRGHRGTVVCLTATKEFVVSTATDKLVKVWNLQTGRCKRTFQNQSVMRAVTVSGMTMITGSETGEVSIWDLQDSLIRKTLLEHTDLITSIKFNKYHIFTGSMDCYAIMWLFVGDLTKSLQTFRHPKEILALDTSYCRLVTACSDGQIRVWNQLNGECLRVIRGNSRNDAITSLFASRDRFVVNTVNCILVYNFESVVWDYTAPRDRSDINNKILTTRPKASQPHGCRRALRFLYHGSPIHQRTQSKRIEQNRSSLSYKTNLAAGARPDTRSQYGTNTEKGENNSSIQFYTNGFVRLEAWPIRTSVNKGCKERDVLRTKSAPAFNKCDSNYCHGNRRVNSCLRNNKSKDWTNVNQNGSKSCVLLGSMRSASNVLVENTLLKTQMKSPGRLNSKTGNNMVVKARCRSAPAYRVQTLPPSERGFTTSSFSYTDLTPNKMILKVESVVTKSRPISAGRLVTNESSLERLSELKIKTFHSQLEFEEKLRKQ